MDKNRMPSAARIEAAAQWLLARGDRRSAVQIVERWAEVAEPSAKARLVQAEAWLGLGLPDRAWMSLKELVEPAMSDPAATPSPAQYDALKLAGTLFVDRGWTSKAKRPLELAMQVAPNRDAAEAVRVLLARADVAAPALPDEPPAGADDVTGLVNLAQKHLVAGAQIKAKKLLERARRIDPENTRADELLWALRGDYSNADVTLAELVDRAVPDLSAALPAAGDITEDTDDRTEEADRDGPGDGDEKAKSFPSLFRAPGGPAAEGRDPTTSEDTSPDGGGEGTASMRMADLPKLSAFEPPTEGASIGGDTQIARVIRHGAGAEIEPNVGPIHSGIADAVDKTFDLAAFRREMGMDVTPAVAQSDYDGGFEEEDISRVVRVAPMPDAGDPSTGGFLEQLDPDTSGDALRAATPPPGLGSEAPTSIASDKPKPAASAPAERPAAPASSSDLAALAPAPKATPRPAVRRTTTAPGTRRRRLFLQWYLLAIGLVLLFGAGMVFLLVLVTFLKG